jgi:hypothetical protein
MLDGDGVGRIVSLTDAALGRCALGYLDGRVDDAAASRGLSHRPVSK